MADQLSKFEFNGHGLRILPSNDGTSFWVVAKDVTDILGYSRPEEALRKIPKHHKGTQSLRTPGGVQKMLCVDEPGLYRLVLRSDKPEAEPFMEWVTSQVLPSIRRTGAYQRQSLPNPNQDPRDTQRLRIQNGLLNTEVRVHRSHIEEVIVRPKKRRYQT